MTEYTIGPIKYRTDESVPKDEVHFVDKTGNILTKIVNLKIEMTPEQEEHLMMVKTVFCDLVDRKYRAGAKEHGGDLWQHDILWLVDQAIMEQIDGVVYLLTLREKIKK